MGDLATEVDKLFGEDSRFDEVGPAFARFLTSQQEIRCLLSRAGGFGHQSATVTLLKRIVDEFGFAGPEKLVTVVWQEAEKGQTGPLEKLENLLPGFKRNDPDSYRYRDTPFRFIKFDAKSGKGLEEKVTFAFTGAVDRQSSDENFTGPLNAEHFLLMLPYLWTGKALQHAGGSETSLDEILGERTDNFQRQPVTDKTWSDLAYDQRMPALRKLIESTGPDSTLKIWPSYVVIDPKPILAVPADEIATILVAGISSALRKSSGGKTPGSSVILNFGGLKDPDTVFAKTQKLLDGGMTAWEQTQLSGERPSFTARKKTRPAYEKRQALLKTLFSSDVNNWVRFLKVDVSVAALEEAMSWANKLPGRVIFLQFGSAPPVLFNDVCANSRLPPLFEGVTTASKQVTFGVPFLHLPRSRIEKYKQSMLYMDDAPLAYPGFLDGANYVAEAAAADYTARHLIYAFDREMRPGNEDRDDPFGAAVERLEAFLGTAYDPQSTLGWYFKKMADVRNKPVNDRFTRALAEFLKATEPAPDKVSRHALLDAPAGTDLKPVWTDLRDAVGPDKRLDVFAGVLAGNPVASQALKLLRGLTGSSGSMLVLSNAKVLPDTEPTDKVTVSGEFEMRGFTCSVSVEYTALPGGLAFAIRFQTESPWHLPGAPWLAFEHVGFGLSAWEAPAPMQGMLFASGAGAAWGVNARLAGVDGWVLEGKFDPAKVPSTAEMFQLAAGTNFLHGLPGPLAGFKVENFRVVYQPEADTVESVAVQLGDDGPWEPIEGLSAEQMRLAFVVRNPGDPTSRKISGSFNAVARLSSGTELGLGARFPDFTISATLLSDQWLLGHLLSDFGLPVSIPDSYSPAITELELQLDPRQKHFSIYATLSLDWQVNAGDVTFALTSVRFTGGKQPDTFATLTGYLQIGDVPLVLCASYRSKTWEFTGQQAAGTSISIANLAKKLLPADTQPPPELGDVSVSDLHVRMATHESGDSEYDCGVKLKWTPGPKGNESFKAELAASLSLSSKLDKDKKRITEGKIAATWPLHGAELEVSTSFGTKTDVAIGFAGISATYDFEKKQATLRLGDWSLGDMLASFTGWLKRPVALDPPWSLLNEVNLKDFALTIDVGKETIALAYPADRDLGIKLGFVSIKQIKLTYQPKEKDKQKGVLLALKVSGFLGNFPDAESEKNQELAWNPAEESPPVPGFGNEFFDLRLLALGQHVSFSDTQFTSVEDVIQSLKTLPVPKDNQLPVVANPPKGQPRFDSNSNWLIAADFGLLRLPSENGAAKPGYFIDLSIIFNDPNLYGLRLKLDGDMAKALKGLVFDILYKKITDTLGVYEIELELPEAMRTLDFGAMSVTMPVIRLQIYTNGDFLVDLGFPHNKDFSQSFAFQALVPPGVPMIGAGGFYFGMLSGAAAPKLPATDNGTFNPVTTFGIGLQVGLGKRINKGVFQAELTLVVVGILEGTIATWHPKKPDVHDGSHYYWLQGTLGIVGTVHGYVDFKIIKAGVHIELYAYVSVTYEAYRPMPIDLVAGVTVKATLTINAGLFKIHLKFSFHAEIRESLIVGKKGDAPWDARKLTARSRYLSTLHDNLDASPLLFAPLPPADKTTLQISAVPISTVRRGDSRELADQLAAVAVALFIKAPGQDADANTDTPFDLLCRELTTWLVSSYFRQVDGVVERESLAATPISAEQLDEISRKLSEPHGALLNTAAICDFLSQHFVIQLGALDDELDKHTVSAFPMFPALSLHIPAVDGQAETVHDFSSFNALSGDDVRVLEEYFSRLQVQNAAGASPSQKPSAADSEPSISAAALLFEDYFRMLLRHLAQAAIETIRHYRYPLKPGESLDDIHAWAVASGGSDISMLELVQANRQLKLDSDKAGPLVLDDYRYQAIDGDTLADIVEKRCPGKPVSSVAAANAKRQNLLRPGAIVQFGGEDHTVALLDDLARLAGRLNTDVETLVADTGVQNHPTLLLPHGEWRYPSLELETGESLEAVAGSAGITLAQLVNATNTGRSNLFLLGKEPVSVNIPHLDRLPVDDILAGLRETGVFANLSGIAARNAMHGLRLPSLKDLASGQDEALYEFSGQQADLPTLTGESYTLKLSKAAGADWLQFKDGGDALDVVLDKTDITRINAQLAQARGQGVRPGVSSVGASRRYRDLPAQFPLQTHLPWHAGGDVTLPSQPGQPADQQNLRLWPLPPALLALASEDDDFVPLLAPKAGVRNETDGQMSVSDIDSYGWATRVQFSIRRLDDNDVAAGDASDPAKDVYVVEGADYQGVQLLENILQTVAVNPGLSIASTRLLFAPGAESDQPSLLLSGDDAGTTWFVTRVNLSNRTQPVDPERLAVAAEPGAVLGAARQNLRLLWEASITRSGGCYLHYSDPAADGGLPDNLFDGEGKAQLELLLTFTDSGEPLTRLSPFINTLISADPVDPEHSVVFAEIVSEQVQHTVSDADTLDSLATAYRSLATRILEDNASHPLRAGTEIALQNVVYLTRPASRAPGRSLQDIAAWFGVSAADIRELNQNSVPDFDDIPELTALIIPDLRYTVAANDTAASVSERFGHGIAAIAAANGGTAGLFDTAKPLTIATGPVDRQATLGPGEMGFDVRRSKPADPDTSPAAALDNLYQYLGFNIQANAAFEQSPMGMPVGPTEPTADADASDSDSDDWEYRVAFRYVDFLRSTDASSGPDHSPYAGIGKLLQPAFEWRDPLGNRVITPMNQPELDPASPLNNPPARVTYTDRLLGVGEWPGVSASYQLGAGTNGKPALTVSLQFDASPYTSGEQANDRAKHDLRTWQRILEQCRDVGADGSPAVTIGVEASLRKTSFAPCAAAERQALEPWIGQIQAFLRDVAEGKGGDADAIADWKSHQALEHDDLVSRNTVELTVALTLSRHPQWVDPSFSGVNSVQKAPCVLPPRANTGTEQNLAELAGNIEKAFRFDKQWCWKLASGPGTKNRRNALWLVRFDLGSNSGLRLDLQPGASTFAVPPLATEMQSADSVAIYPYQKATGIDWTATPKKLRYSGIDLDRWGESFFEAFDQLLSATRATKIAIVDRKSESADKPMQQLLKAKKRLAACAARSAQPVIDSGSAESPLLDGRALEAARERLRQEFLVQLSAAYAPQTAVYFRGRVTQQSDAGPMRAYGVYQPAAAIADDRTYSLDAAKATLNGNVDNDETDLVFLLTVASARSQKSVQLDGAYRITHIEHDIHPVEGIAEYEGSSWLSFVLPDNSANAVTVSHFAAPVEVPVPLREYPNPPTLDSQSAAPSADNPRQLSQLISWDFATRYAARHTAQDELLVTVNFNVASKFAMRAAGRSLLEELAQFTDTWPALKADLGASLAAIAADTEPGSDEMKQAQVSLAAFASMASRLADAWENHGTLAAAAPMGASVTYRINESAETFALQPDVLHVSLETTSGQHDFNAQPEIPGYSTILDQRSGSFVFSDRQTKEYLTYTEAQSIADRDLKIRNLDIRRYQNAWASVAVIRNEHLLEHSSTATNPAFVYRTPDVLFPQPLLPSLDSNYRFDVAKIEKQQSRTDSLAGHLDTLLHELLPEDPAAETHLQIEVRYAYTLAEWSPDAELPVLFMPGTSFADAAARQKLGADLATSIDQWKASFNPAGSNPYYLFDITLLSSDALTERPHPLLRVSNVILYLADIRG